MPILFRKIVPKIILTGVDGLPRYLKIKRKTTKMLDDVDDDIFYAGGRGAVVRVKIEKTVSVGLNTYAFVFFLHLN